MKKFLTAIVLVMLFGTSAGEATLINLQGVEYPGTISAVADFNYEWLSETSGKIDVTLLNTSSVSSALTAFAFNAPLNVTSLNSFVVPNADWSAVYTPDKINTPGQFGFFDLAAITGSNFNGGKPLNGIWDGNSGSFVLELTGSGMNALTTESFLGLFSDLDGKTGSAQNFIARYQAIGYEGGSDVAIPKTLVPEPATALFLGSGLCGVVFWRRRQ